MNILVTGATGFIGSHLVKKLLSDGNQVTAVIRRHSNTDDLDKKIRTYVYDGDIVALIEFLKSERFDGVIHLAAHCPTGHPSNDLASLIDTNVLFGTEMIEAASRAGIKWFINTGSYMQHYEDKDYSPSILYAATKQAFLNITRYWTDYNQINAVTLELFDNFGVDDKRKKIFTLWREALKTGEPVSMSPGQQIIDASPVENVVDAFLHLASLLQQDEHSEMSGQVFSLRSEYRMTLREWAEMFQKVAGRTLNLNWGSRPYRNREIMNPWTKGALVPGYHSTTPLEDAIKKYLEV